MENFFQLYGPLIVYIAIFLGSLVEGESVVLTCSILSYRYEAISLPLLMFLAFLGSMSADQTLFFLGRRYGPGLIQRRPQWQQGVEKVFHYMRRHSTLFILSFRFIYGIRTLSPIVIGASGVAVKRFAVLNFFAAMVWAILSCGLGYLLGHLFSDRLEVFFSAFGQYKKGFAAAVVVALALGGLWYFYKNGRTQNR